jgi:hypothetical protein
MNDVHLYHLTLAGQVTASEMTAFCPPGAEIERDGETYTILTVRTDQAGLVGLIRQLHGLGFELMSFNYA